MTQKEASFVLFGIFSLGSGIACFFWSTAVRPGYGFLIGGFWVASMNVIQYLIEKRVGDWWQCKRS